MASDGVDVVVAGAGAAGTAAALAAAQGGLTVALVEANEHVRRGCNTAMSTSMVPAGGSRWQAEAGLDDSPERFLEDIRRKTGGQADERLAKALVEIAPGLVVWLADDWGVPLALVTDFHYPGHSVDRCHAVPDRSGATLHAHLLDAVGAADAVTLMKPIRLQEVDLDAAGAVAAARVTSPDGRVETVPTTAVVLATNGFGADGDLVARHLPGIADGRYHGGDGSTGDALRIGAQLGADTAYLDAYQGHGSLAIPHGVLLTWAFVMHGGYLVNAHGRRFGDETTGYSEYGPLVTDQPGAVAWAVYDRRIHEQLLAFRDYQDLLEVEAVRWVRDVTGLAASIGAGEDVVEGTVAAAGGAARGERPDPHGRTDWERPLEPPFAVVKVTGALFHTQGGLHVDGHGRVLRDGAPIEGLYAAGGAAHGISGHGAEGYLAGNGLLSALGLGLLAGRHLGGAA